MSSQVLSRQIVCNIVGSLPLTKNALHSPTSTTCTLQLMQRSGRFVNHTNILNSNIMVHLSTSYMCTWYTCDYTCMDAPWPSTCLLARTELSDSHSTATVLFSKKGAAFYMYTSLCVSLHLLLHHHVYTYRISLNRGPGLCFLQHSLIPGLYMGPASNRGRPLLMRVRTRSRTCRLDSALLTVDRWPWKLDRRQLALPVEFT